MNFLPQFLASCWGPGWSVLLTAVCMLPTQPGSQGLDVFWMDAVLQNFAALQNLHLAGWIPGKEAHLGKEKPLETQGALRQLLRFVSREVTPKQLYAPPQPTPISLQSQVPALFSKMPSFPRYPPTAPPPCFPPSRVISRCILFNEVFGPGVPTFLDDGSSPFGGSNQ